MLRTWLTLSHASKRWLLCRFVVSIWRDNDVNYCFGTACQLQRPIRMASNSIWGRQVTRVYKSKWTVEKLGVQLGFGSFKYSYTVTLPYRPKGNFLLRILTF